MPSNHPSYDLILHRLSSSDYEIKLKVIREVKNQIIGNRTKKLSYIKLGAVPAVTDALATANADSDFGFNLIVQCAAVLGSFACGVDQGVRAVLDAGAFPHLIRFLKPSNEKVVDAAARSLRMIYQSKLAPKFDFYKEENMDFLLSLLISENENLIGLGAGVIIHSCETSDEQNILCQAGSLEKLISSLDGSINQRDASLESLATILKNNPDAVLKFVYLQNGRALHHVIELTKGRYSRTSLLACLCLTCIKITSSSYWQDIKIKIKLICILFEFLDDSGQVGEEVSFAFSSLSAGKEDLQKLENAIDKFYNQPKQQSHVSHVYDKFSHTHQFKMECILFFHDVSDCLQFPIPSFKQFPEILAAAQLYREKHPPNIYKQFDGNREKLGYTIKARWRCYYRGGGTLHSCSISSTSKLPSNISFRLLLHSSSMVTV